MMHVSLEEIPKLFIKSRISARRGKGKCKNYIPLLKNQFPCLLYQFLVRIK